jgi:iron complex transport system ATP-binding protein
MSSCFQVNNLSWNGVLKNVSFKLAYNESTFLVGPNGAGKSSLLKLLCGLERTEKGEVYWEDTSLATLDSQRRADLMAFVPAESQVGFPIQVLDFLLQSRLYKKRLWEGYSRGELDEAMSSLRELNCDHLQNRLCSRLSSGEWQRVMLARALHQNPQCLLLDEPQAHQDLRHQWTGLFYLRNWLSPTKALFTVSHDINLALQFGERMIALKEGEIFFDKSPADIHEKEIQELYESKHLKLIDDDGRRLLAFSPI